LTGTEPSAIPKEIKAALAPTLSQRNVGETKGYSESLKKQKDATPTKKV